MPGDECSDFKNPIGRPAKAGLSGNRIFAETSRYSFFDRGLIIRTPFQDKYPVTSIMSQRSLFIQTLGNI